MVARLCVAVIGRHGPHHNYTAGIQKKIDLWRKQNPDYTPEQARAFLERIARDAKKAIKENEGVVNTVQL